MSWSSVPSSPRISFLTLLLPGMRAVQSNKGNVQPLSRYLVQVGTPSTFLPR